MDLAWQHALKRRFADAKLPCDSPDQPSLHVKGEDWFAMAAPLFEAITGSRDEALALPKN